MYKFFALTAFLLLQSSLFAQTTTNSVFSFLTRDESTAIQMELDVNELLVSKKNNQYLPATLTTADGTAFKIEVRARGKFRRKNCEIPPIKLKFSKKSLAARGLDTLNEVKLTLPCYDDPRGEDLILREYLAYRMFEKLSPYHLKVRLVRLTLRDTKTAESKKQVYALLVEHDEELAVRLGGTIVETYNLGAKEVDYEQYALNVVFQYMIGNTDWELATFRNIYQFKSAQDGKVKPIPYDFDFSGFVSAPYATPAVTTGLKSVQDRYLMADGVPNGSLRSAVQTVKNARRQLMPLLNARWLSDETSTELKEYLGKFFDAAEESLDLPQRLSNTR